MKTASNEAVTAAEFTVGVGESITIYGSGFLGEGSWTSEGSAATVTGNGNIATITGVSVGDVTVTYTYTLVSTRTETFVVHVVGDQPKVSIEGDLVVGGKIKLSVQNFENTDAIQWASDNTEVATIDSDGVVEGISVGKANITASAGSESATKQIEVKRDESNGGYYVYLYTKVEGNTKGLALTPNKDGWYTIGRVWVDDISAPTFDATDYVTSGDNYDKVIAALRDPSNVDLYGVNSINLEDIEWSVAGQSTGLKTASGASDYDTSNNPTWHLDGYVNFDKVGFGSVVFHYVDALNRSITIAEDETVTAKATEPGKTFDFSKYIIPIEGYTYYTANPLSVTIDKGTTKHVTLYYSKLPKRQIVMQAKSGTAPYSGQEQSASGFESDTFEFDGVKYTVSGLTATAKGTDAGTHKGTVEGTAVVTDPEGNDVTAQFDVAAQPGELVIAKRDVTLKPVDAEKPYDGSALTASEFEVAAGSFAEGEGVESCTYTGSRTLVGSSGSAIASATALAGTNLENNYNVTYAEGRLTVTDRAEKYAIVMQAKSGTAPYSGQEQSASGFESDTFEFDGVKYTVSGLTATAKGTDAGTHKGTVEGTAVVTDPEGNDVTAQFDVAAQPGELVITPAPYSVTTESATKVYDGTALTAGGKIEGLLEGETANLKVTGSQTKVGASENAYTIEWTGTAKESNYKLESESIGTLTVAAAPDSPTPDDQSKDQGIFNGNDANSGLVQTGDATGIYGMAAIIAAVVAAFVSLLAVRRRKE